MQGYKLKFKRSCDSRTVHQAQKLVLLGYVEGEDVAGLGTEEFPIDRLPQSELERVAGRVPPLPNGQDI